MVKLKTAKFDYSKCNKEQKFILHDVCFTRCALSTTCSADHKECIALIYLEPDEKK